MTWYDHGITYYHHLYKEHMINSWSTSKLKDTIHHFREPHFRHRHRHIHARSHGPSCRCPYILEVRPLHFNQLRGRLLKMILVVNPPKAGESNVYIKSIWMFFQLKKKVHYFRGPGGESLKFHSCRKSSTSMRYRRGKRSPGGPRDSFQRCILVI